MTTSTTTPQETALDAIVATYADLVTKGWLLSTVRASLTNKGVPAVMADKIVRLVEFAANEATA